MPLFEITTISVYRHKYVIEAKNKDDACDAVMNEHPEELSQKPIEEVVTDSKRISEKDFICLLSRVQQESSTEYCIDNSRLGQKIIYRVKYPNA